MSTELTDMYSDLDVLGSDELNADNLAYVIYTSGSTGRPKGVMIEHRSIVSQMNWLRSEYGIGPGRTVLQKTPMSFDAAQWEILAPATGATVVVGAPGIYRDPERLIDTVIQHQVTTLQCVPTLLQGLVDTEEFSNCTSLTQVFSGGEALTHGLAARCTEELPGSELINLYGPTECTINSSAHTVDPEVVSAGPGTVPIGTPVDETQYYILDADGSSVPLGEIGELYIGGVQVSRGYLHAPELTASRFVPNPFVVSGGKLYRTGDLTFWNADGTVQFVGRADNQVKLRGFRVELDEIRLAIEAHDWIRHAAVVVRDNDETGFQNLIAFVELDPKEAALMDQGNHGGHHQSKASKLQVKAQLANRGVRDAIDLAGRPETILPGWPQATRQRRLAFSRKTYRFFEGRPVNMDDILQLLAEPARIDASPARDIGDIGRDELGEIMCYFGQHISSERLLPKFGYASPGSLYATQMYLDLCGVAGLASGIYYYDPTKHRLILISERPERTTPDLTIHFIGKRSAIEPVYQNNIREVLEVETGHMVGLFEHVLPAYGLSIRAAAYEPSIIADLAVAAEDYYLATFALQPGPGTDPDATDVYVQAHPGRVAGFHAGHYRYAAGRLELISSELIQKKHVIAINQSVYERASIGISVVSRTDQPWREYVDLGRKLQHIQLNDLGLGFMSAGYSSKSGHPLPASRRLDAILRDADLPTGPSYFFVGGGISEEQIGSEGMKEDTVHMKGPAEMLRDDLTALLPNYMVPNRVVVLDKLPLMANGKVDVRALDAVPAGPIRRDVVAPRTAIEKQIDDIWGRELKLAEPSVTEDFFEAGGNSLTAVGIVNKINREFGSSVPLQALFESPTIEQLALWVDDDRRSGSRLVRLADGPGRPIFCWPGLGGYAMNLRSLAASIDLGRPFHGVQALGINSGETPFATIAEMAAADVTLIRKLQSDGPYTLTGYSFGARVAFEAAFQLEQLGATVDQLVLIAPGQPRVRADDSVGDSTEPIYRNAAFVTILYSVFAGSIGGPDCVECLRVTHDEPSFVAFVHGLLPDLEPDVITRITRIVGLTFSFRYTFHELTVRRIAAPVTILKASGDDYSFIEGTEDFSVARPTVFDLAADHYGLLRAAGVEELATIIRRCLTSGVDTPSQESQMPHVNVKYFPMDLTDAQESAFVAAIASAVTTTFGCDPGVISVALEPIAKDAWTEAVYIPEIIDRRSLLRKTPNY